MLLALIIIFSALGGIGAMSLAGLFLLVPEKTRQPLNSFLISYATGTLLGAAFLALIPHALEHLPEFRVFLVLLGGILFFFLLEKLLIWHHCYNQECDIHRVAGPMLMFGDAFHNFLDGIVIASAFIINVPLGVTTFLAVVSHEIPQEVGDFAVLLESGYSRGRAFLYNALSGSTTLVGAVPAYFFLERIQTAIPYVMAVAAASFIYIAIADLIPSLHRFVGFKNAAQQLLSMLAGIATVVLVHLME